MSLRRLEPSNGPSNSTPVKASAHPLQRARKSGASQRRHRHTAGDWERLKVTISNLYLVENKSADDVVNDLSREHDFKVSRRKLFEKLKDWGIWKKLKKEHIKPLLEKENARLHNDGKDTKFFFPDGKPLTVERLERSIQRSGCSLADLKSSTTSETPPGITYQTPPASSPESQRWHQDSPPSTAIDSEMLVTATIGYLVVAEPDTQHITHKHKLGRFSLTSMGFDLSDEARRCCTLHVHEIGRKFRMSMPPLTRAASRKHPEMSNPMTWPSTPSHPGCWAKYPESYDLGDVNLIWAQLKESELRDFLGGLHPEIGVDWNYDQEVVHFCRLSEDDQRIAAQIETMFPCRWNDVGQLALLDIFIILQRQSELKSATPPVMKVTLGLDIQPGPQCSICETDVFTVDIITDIGAIAVQTPLSPHNQGPEPKQRLYLETKSKRGTWKAIASQSAGWDTALPCVTKAPFELRREFCLTRYEVDFESGEWDPHSKNQHPECFQAFPIDREHVCCNHPGMVQPEFQPRPRYQEVWDPDGLGDTQADMESDEYEDW